MSDMLSMLLVEWLTSTHHGAVLSDPNSDVLSEHNILHCWVNLAQGTVIHRHVVFTPAQGSVQPLVLPQ